MGAAVALVLLSGCSDSGPTGPTVDPETGALTGVYVLQTYRGNAVPFSFASGSSTLTIVADTIRISESGQWGDRMVIRELKNGVSTESGTPRSGTMDRNGASVIFREPNNPNNGNQAYSGSFSGNGFLITEVAGGATLAFRRL